MPAAYANGQAKTRSEPERRIEIGSKRLNAALYSISMMRMQRLSKPSKVAMSARTLLVRCAAGLALAGCATVTPVGTDPIDLRYSVGGGQWNSGRGITVVARAFERNGVAVICGAWTIDSQSGLTRDYNDDVLEAGSVFLDGDRAVQNLSFMRRVPYSDNIAGEQANCVATGLPWKADYDAAPARIRMPRMAFVLDADPMHVVKFRETQRAAIIR